MIIPNKWLEIIKGEGMELAGLHLRYSTILNNSNRGKALADDDYLLWNILSETKDYLYLKKTSDMSYIDYNKKMLDLFFKKEDYMNNAQFPSLSSFIESVEELEKQVITNKVSYKDILSKPFLNMNGRVLQLSITLYPLLNQDKTKVEALMFYGQDVTPKIPHNDLRMIYEDLYNNKIALSKFLEHIGFTDYIIGNTITKREYDILHLFSYGKTAKEIALKLNISFRTVEIHLNNIKKKVNARNKIEVMRKFLLCYRSSR